MDELNCTSEQKPWEPVYDEIAGVLIGRKKLPLITNLMERFWTRFEASEGCWVWKGAIEPDGYGCVYLGARSRISAHRLSWILHNGPISSNKIYVCHKCDNPPCVRPDHLFLGTSRDNMRDAADKGRLDLEFCKRGHPMSGTARRNNYNGRRCELCEQIYKQRRLLVLQIRTAKAKLKELRDL